MRAQRRRHSLAWMACLLATLMLSPLKAEPPTVDPAVRASIEHLRSSNAEREKLHERVRTLRARLDAIGVPHLDNPSHIVPVMVCDPVVCKSISDILLDEYGIYVQPINYPTVPRGTERLRITPGPAHTDAMIDDLAAALLDVWLELDLPQQVTAVAAE